MWYQDRYMFHSATLKVNSGAKIPKSRKMPVTSPVYTRSKVITRSSFVLSTTINHSSLLKFIKMKKTTIIFWVSTIIIFLMEGVIPAFTSQTELAKEGIRHLGYPAYFGNMLVLFKVAGAMALILPQVSNRIKEWAYAGFAFDFIAAAVSHGAVDGIGNFQTLFPLIFLVILAASYITYHKKLKVAAAAKTETINSINRTTAIA
jgi:DoxX-like family